MDEVDKRFIRRLIVWGIVLIMVLSVVGWGFGLFDRVANPDRVVASYEQFFNRCASVQSLETQRDQLQEQLDGETDEEEIRRLKSALTGVRSQRARAINNYNAEATMVTRQWFQSERLPARLNEDEEHTTCAL